MARRKRQSTAEDFMDLVALLPWWAGLLLALVSYVLFHGLAAKPVAVDPGAVGNSLLPMVVAGVSRVLQYLVPLLCLFGAVASFMRRRKREGLAAEAAAGRNAEILHDMTWRDFELLVGEAFRLEGFVVHEVGGGGADGGVDLVLRRGTETHLVQCKQWKALRVGVGVVRELYGVMAARGAAGGFVVTSGRFTDDAAAFASGRNLRLVDGNKLHAMLQQARAARLAGRGASPATAQPPQEEAAIPGCPKCNASMVRRTARKGANTGQVFWGCSNFPKCHGTRA